MELFLRNLLLEEGHELHNRSMHISGKFTNDQKADIGVKKADIGAKKADIGFLKEYENELLSFSDKTITHVQKMYEAFGKDTVFGRAGVQAVTGLKHTRASEFLKILTEAKLIEPVSGHGKGKYRFCPKLNGRDREDAAVENFTSGG